MVSWLLMQANSDTVRVTVVTVVYGSRWPLLKQVADACLADSKVAHFIITDNGSSDPVSMDEYASRYSGRITVLRQEKNIGFSGAVSKGLEYARTTESDFVFILDDDSVPETGAIDFFLHNLQFFPGEQVVLCANRVDVPGNNDVFRQRPFREAMPKGTIFDVLNIKKIAPIVKLLLKITPKADRAFVPLVPAEAFVTGGTFLPMEVVRKAPLPDKNLFIYGEDLEYAWRIRRMGYKIYVCAKPIIRDIDMTFSSYGAHIYGLFEPATAEYKVFFRMRNAVVISKRNTTQSQIVLLLNMFVWFGGLFVIGFFKLGPTKTYFRRLQIITKAVVLGYRQEMAIPDDIKTPT